MKASISITLLILTLFLWQCEKEKESVNCDFVKITTQESTFSASDSVKFEIENNSNDTIYLYCPCIGTSYTPFSRLDKLENSTWIDIFSTRICTGFVLPEIWTQIPPNSTIERHVPIYESGQYRFQCRFLYNADTISCYSNIFAYEK